MKTKADYINYWEKSADFDWDATLRGDFPQALFFAHLVLEKLLKGHFVQHNTGNFPPQNPQPQNAGRPLGQSFLVGKDLQLLDTLNDFQMEGRYPDFEFEVFEKSTRAFTGNLLDEVNIFRIWLLNQLP